MWRRGLNIRYHWFNVLTMFKFSDRVSLIGISFQRKGPWCGIEDTWVFFSPSKLLLTRKTSAIRWFIMWLFCDFFFLRSFLVIRGRSGGRKSLSLLPNRGMLCGHVMCPRHMSPKRVHCLNSLPFTNRNFSKKGPKISAEVDESLYFS